MLKPLIILLNECMVLYLDNKGVQDGVIHATDVKMKNLEREVLQDGNYLHNLARDSP